MGSKSNIWNETQILQLVAGFRDRTLPKEGWTHEAHLVTSIWFFSQFSMDEAICYLRSGIITFNHEKGGKNTPQDGYHETLTLFWCKIISDFVHKHQGLSLNVLCNNFIESEQAARDFPFRFYSKELLMSVKARARWVEPDIEPMP